MNLPLSKLNRDEIYTFIVGFFTGLSWYLYFQEIEFIAKKKDAVDPALVLAWLFSAGLVYILCMVLYWTFDLICQREIEKQDDDAKLKKMNLTKRLSFFWAGPLEDQRLSFHIYALITVSQILIYHPVMAFTSANLSLSRGLSWLMVIHLTYTALTIVACLMVSKTSHYLHQVEHFLGKNYCDILDETTYRRERATHYAKITHDIYFAYLMKYSRENAAVSATTQPESQVNTTESPTAG